MIRQKYSVLMSVYWKENPLYLEDSILSMLNQTEKPDEIVIVKDGQLGQELNELISKYERQYLNLFTVVTLEKNLGLGLALNEGIIRARNELIARMDSDDISLENRCELQLVEFEKNPKLDIVGTWTDEFFENPNNVVTSRAVPERLDDIMEFSRRRSPFNHPTVMYKKSTVLKSGGYRDISRKEDIELFTRMLHDGSQAMNIQKSLLLFRSSEENYKRRKSWVNCTSYIKVIYKFWRLGYSSFIDLVVVTIGQVVMFLSPVWFLKILSDSLLRKKV